MERIINKLKVSKKNIICFILGAIIFSAISVYAATYFPSNQVTYNNSASGLSSTNVQGAIDELYNTCSSAVSSGDYLYYAENRYSSDYPAGGTIYRCNADGGGCVTVSGANSGSSIAAIYGNSKYMYYAVNYYSFSSSGPYPAGGTIYRCDLGGGSCTSIGGVSNDDSIGFIYVNNKYMYYAVNYYSFSSSGPYPAGGTIYRCDLGGGSCTSIGGVSNGSSIG